MAYHWDKEGGRWYFEPFGNETSLMIETQALCLSWSASRDANSATTASPYDSVGRTVTLAAVKLNESSPQRPGSTLPADDRSELALRLIPTQPRRGPLRQT
ncbi:hypothetical protein Pst134EB_014654 [Puccinia striiformis f. sp. tritici]|nr:hypothetical protein Pst134EB_014654 [Puccinia striiformis f. sp. tritici]